jgi:hypothetical protein
LKQNEVEPTLVSEILGHHVKNISLGRYGKAFKLEVMSKAMQCLATGLVPQITDFTLVPHDDENRIEIRYRVNGSLSVKRTIRPGQFGITVNNNINYEESFSRPDWYGYQFLHEIHLSSLWREPVNFELVQDVLGKQGRAVT